MAKCYNCGGEIGYFSFWRGCFKNLSVNFRRSKQRPISNCPHCGAGVQENAGTAYGFLGFIIGFFLVAYIIVDSLKIELPGDLAVILTVFITAIILQSAWWKFISKLQKPDY